MTSTPVFRPRQLGALACLSLGLLLSACQPNAVVSQFELDVCGHRQQWALEDRHWGALYAAQLPGDEDLVLAFRVPPATAGNSDGNSNSNSNSERESQDEGTLQFKLIGPPDTLTAAKLQQLVRSYRVGLATDARPPSDTQQPAGSVTLWDSARRVHPGGAGALTITSARVVAQDGGTARGAASGEFQFELPQGPSTCTVRGRFQDASFTLRR